MKQRIFSLFTALCLCLTLLPTAAFAEENGTCTHTSATQQSDGSYICANEECGKPLIAEVTSTTATGTAISYLASGDTDPDHGVNDDVSLIARAFGDSSTTKVKLLANVTPAGDGATIGFSSPNQTLDLNGHALDTVGGSIALLPMGGIPSVTITDSSAKTGKLKAQVQVISGTLTINSGTLTAETRTTDDGEHYTISRGPITIEGGSMTVSGTAKVDCSTITVKGSSSSSNARPGSLTVQDTAQITGGIDVKQNGALTMTGGTVEMQPSATVPGSFPADTDKVFVNGGTANANISGGSIVNLTADSGSVELSGGTYGIVEARSGSTTDLLKNGYAYFTKVEGSEDYTPTAPNNNIGVSSCINVAVKTHECEYVQSGDTWTCGCGRTATQQPIAYMDENGNTAYCMDYEDIPTDPDQSIESGWYVARVLSESPTINGTLNIAEGKDVHLILCDNTELKVNGSISCAGSLTVYAQRLEGDEDHSIGKLTVSGGEQGGAILSLGDLTINGGEITVNASTELSSSAVFTNGIYSVAVGNKLTVNGGKLTVTAPGYTNNSEDYDKIEVQGIYAYDLTVNGGEIDVTGGTITTNNKKISSYGIRTKKLTVNGGEVSASGAAIDATCSISALGNTLGGYSYGVFVESESIVPGTGAASITGGTLTANGGNVTTTGYAPYMTAKSEGLSVANATVNATGGNASVTVNPPSEDVNYTFYPDAISYGLFANMTLKSGTVTAKSGTAEVIGCDDADVEALDLYSTSRLTMQGGTLTDGTETGSVLAYLFSLDMTGGTLKLKEGSKLTSVSASPLNAPLPDGYAYYEVNRYFSYETGLTETNVDFVTLGDLTALNPDEDDSTAYYVRRCTHSAEYGVCAYCGKDFTPAPTPSTPSGGSSRPSYAVSAPATDNGSVSVSPKTAKKGTSVTITVTPDAGFTLETLTVLDKNGNEIELTDNGDGTYSFKMPAGKVEVKATFAEDNSMLNFFVDVPADTFYYDAVLWAAKKGITGGVDENHFGPDLSCTRAQLVTFLWRAAGYPVVNYAMDFADVDENAYYGEAVRWAASLGIVGGYGNGLFGSDDTITREQMATILYRFAQAMNMDTTQGGMAVREFADYESISGYAIEAMQWAVNAGIMQGYDGNLMPSQPCTRAQIVTMLYRLLGE